MDDSIILVIFGLGLSLLIMYFVIKAAVESAIRDALREDLLVRGDTNMILDNEPKHSSYGSGPTTILLTSPTRVVDRDGFDHFFVTIGNIKVPCGLNERLSLSLEPGTYALEFKQIGSDGRPSYVTTKSVTVSDDAKVYIMTNADGYVIYQNGN